MIPVPPLKAAAIHRAFGEGTLVEIERKASGSYARVRFGETVKTFGYPGAFEQGLLRLKE